MADETPSNEPVKPALLLRAQYIKDLSFENPKSPGSLFSMRDAPGMEVSVNMGAQRLDDTVVELAMQIAVRAIVDNATLFLVDLTYAGVIEARGIPVEQLEQTIFITGAQLVYPFARRVIADVTRDGGFPPVQLEPLDFAAMYAERRNKQQPAA